MNEIELLMTDEFVAFSKSVSEISEEKKALEEQFKKQFEDYKNKKKTLESKVVDLNSKWEAWKKKQLEDSKK